MKTFLTMQPAYAGSSAADELAKLHQLKEIGAINEQEYEARKACILA